MEQLNRHHICAGLLAHVDAGKTTLTERLLAHSGAIRNPGSVDAGTTHSDTLPVERRRGISVKATCMRFSHNGTQIDLIDTPGHADFSAEVERSVWALDLAVLVVCSVEGVQPQTELLFSALKKQNIPVIFFLNKTDRVGADPKGTLAQIRRLLTPKAVFMDDTDAITDLLCDEDENMLERYLEGEVFSDTFLQEKLCRKAGKGLLYPVLSGSALRDEGVERLMDAMVACAPNPKQINELSGIVFAAQQHKTLGRGLWVRLYGGSLENRNSIMIPDRTDPFTLEETHKQLKITQIWSPDGSPSGKISAGEIGIVYGLGDTAIGTVLGKPELLPRKVAPGSLRTPVITVQAIPEKPEEMQALRQACEILAGEDPMLKTRFIRSLEELHISVMGTIQLEILEELLRERFSLNVRFGDPAIIYKETISQVAEGYVAYLAPKPCWAILRFKIEPGGRGSGVQFSSTVPVRTIQARYQNQVAQAIPLALNQGRLGWEVTDVKITLIDGGEHKFHTHPLDFIVATPMAIQDGLVKGGSTLLEPILDIRFLLPQECVGKVMSDINTMRGEVVQSFGEGDRVILDALVPVGTSLDYAVTLASSTGGRGAMSIQLHGYRECPLELGAVTPRRSVDPLDTSKYILAARSALEGGIFNMDQ